MDWCWIMVVVRCNTILALGTVIGSIKKADAAAGLANILNMCLAILGGLWMPIKYSRKY